MAVGVLAGILHCKSGKEPCGIVLHITYKPPPLMPKVLSDHDQLLILLFQRRSIFTHPVGKDIRRNWT